MLNTSLIWTAWFVAVVSPPSLELVTDVYNVFIYLFIFSNPRIFHVLSASLAAKRWGQQRRHFFEVRTQHNGWICLLHLDALGGFNAWAKLSLSYSPHQINICCSLSVRGHAGHNQIQKLKQFFFFSKAEVFLQKSHKEDSRGSFLAIAPCALAMMPIMHAHTAAGAFVKWAGKQLWLWPLYFCDHTQVSMNDLFNFWKPDNVGAFRAPCCCCD